MGKTEDQIIEEGIAKAVKNGQKIGRYEGQAEMLSEIQDKFKSVIPHTFFVDRMAQIKKSMEDLEGQL